jgi:hypothetical protein
LLTIRCAACKRKLYRYDKIGPGEVLRCHKSRIEKRFDGFATNGDKVRCNCGNVIGIDKGKFIKMVAKGFTYSGTWRTG